MSTHDSQLSSSVVHMVIFYFIKNSVIMYFCLCTCMCVRVAVWLRRDCWLVVAIVSRVCLHNIPFLGWLAGASCYCLVSLLVNLVAIIWASDGCCEFILPSLCIWKALHWMAWHVKTIGASSKWRARPLKYGMLFILQWSQMTTHFVFFFSSQGSVSPEFSPLSLSQQSSNNGPSHSH